MSDRTYAEAAAELNIPVTWLQRKAQARQIPHRRYGSYVRFTDEDIAEIRAGNRVEPMTAAPTATILRLRRRSA